MVKKIFEQHIFNRNEIDPPLTGSSQHMPKNSQNGERENQDGLDFANVLHDCLGCGVIMIDGERRVEGFNLEAENITRSRADSVLGRSMELLPAPLQAVVDETFSTAKPITDRLISLRDENQGELDIQVNTTPTLAADGKVARVVVVLNDVSSARKWESNMRRLDRLHSVGTLSASMAHEVKNAFVAVKTFVDLLLEKNPHADLAEIVRQELSRIDSLLGQMRKFSGPAKPAFSPVQLHSVLDKSLQLIQHLLEAKRVTVTRAFAASPDLLSGDQDQMEQAFINLFFNALDAMKPHGHLTVSTEILPAGSEIAGLPQKKNRTLLRVVIQDDGVGISKENMDRLFEPFFTTKPDGTGLGLAITRRIIQEHHGMITAQSEPNKGTAFTLILPASNEPA
jgi:nitrogen-specific signal transduction histidine kinase